MAEKLLQQNLTAIKEVQSGSGGLAATSYLFLPFCSPTGRIRLRQAKSLLLTTQSLQLRFLLCAFTPSDQDLLL
ncbi:hypothetical protein RIEGSTA812A_PEG_1286 [invertebrate metagenome]|uniref:Uncharacterized protein n=1 Tax=invertebrate metagenome TaxID=1711999 RepID=A0A484HAF1_9ZZZZ